MGEIEEGQTWFENYAKILPRLKLYRGSGTFSDLDNTSNSNNNKMTIY